MSQVMESIDVDVPVSVAYNQWTQFEDFPQFMSGVEQVQQLDDTHLHWVASVAGVRREWDAEITEQVPDRVLSWRNIDGTINRGTVTFDEIAPRSTRIYLSLDFEPEGIVENVADKLGFVAGQAKHDLEHFREFISERGVETGEWRGEVHGGQVEDTGMGGSVSGGMTGTGTGIGDDEYLGDEYLGGGTPPEYRTTDDGRIG